MRRFLRYDIRRKESREDKCQGDKYEKPSHSQRLPRFVLNVDQQARELVT
jgi:hypothetical protein